MYSSLSAARSSSRFFAFWPIRGVAAAEYFDFCATRDMLYEAVKMSKGSDGELDTNKRRCDLNR